MWIWLGVLQLGTENEAWHHARLSMIGAAPMRPQRARHRDTDRILSRIAASVICKFLLLTALRAESLQINVLSIRACVCILPLAESPGSQGLAQQNERAGDATLVLCPLGSSASYLGAIAFASRHAFLKLSCSACTKSHTDSRSSGRDRQARQVTAYGELAVPDPLRQLDCVVSRNRLRLVTAHLGQAQCCRSPRPAASSRWQY